MVILSAAVTTKNGRALLSRQFVDMNRLRVEGLLAAFPKLQGTGAARRPNQRHGAFICCSSPRRRRAPARWRAGVSVGRASTTETTET
jgi:hypothetical protein